MKTEYTPGPWEVQEMGDWVAARAFEKEGRMLPPLSVFRSIEERKANAILISAAPNMLEALKKAKAWMAPDYFKDKGEHDNQVFDETYSAINAAINKATGQ